MHIVESYGIQDEITLHPIKMGTITERNDLMYLSPSDLIDIIVQQRAAIAVAERVCSKMEHPTASVTILDQADLRSALDAIKVQS
jgi:hypothetical protein